MNGRRRPAEAVAVIGMGLVVPGANSPEEFWDVLCSGVPQFRPPDARWDLETLFTPEMGAEDRVYLRDMGYVTDFRPHPGTDEGAPGGLDPEAGRWLRHCLRQAIDGMNFRDTDRWQLTVGASAESSQRFEEALLLDRAAASLSDHPSHTTDIQNALRRLYPHATEDPASYLSPAQVRLAAQGLTPDTCHISVLQGACAGSLHAIDAGVKALWADECDIAVCGSSFVLNRMTNILCCVMKAAARDGAVRPFDHAAAGTVFGEGAGLVVLKRHSRAVADGDRIHGVITGTAASTDGRGASIVTPNPAGQQLAVQRALRAAAVTPSEVELILAHGTGTVVGDEAELRMLGDIAAGRARWHVSSNKSLIGHTGWTAGVASLIHGLLVLRHAKIPAQRQFEQVVDPALLKDGALTIPTSDVDWPAHDGRTRTMAVCAYGLGGNNGCLVVSDRVPAAYTPPTTPDTDIVLTAWHAHLPGAPDRRAVTRWLGGGAQQWPDTFPVPYPPPPFEACRLPPTTFATLDASQLTILDSAHGLAGQIGPPLKTLAPRTGVYLGHLGPTRNSVEYTLRAGLDDLARRYGPGLLPGPQRLTAAQFTRKIRTDIPRAVSDTYTSLLCCITASRVSVQHDLHGPALSYEAGTDSVLAAVDAARLQLLGGSIDLALVFGVAANAAHGATFLEPARGQRLREGAFALCLARRDTAEREGLPVLAVVGRGPLGPRRQEPLEPEFGGFLGGEGAVRILRALVSDAPTTHIAPRASPHTPVLTLSTPRTLPTPSAPASTADRPFFFLRQLETRTPRHARWLIPLDGRLDSFLEDHVVDGRPTMPGTVLIELAAQAATAAVEGLVPRSFHDVSFEAFVRLPAAGRPPLVLKAVTDLVERAPGRAVVEVRLLSDVVLPTGRVVHVDRTHMTTRVVLGSYLPQRPFWEDARRAPDEAATVADVYCAGHAAHRLSGAFDSLRDLRLHDSGGSARWHPVAGPSHPAYARFRTPAILLDALLRTGQLCGPDGGADVPAVPLGMRKVTLNTQGNDIVLAGLFGSAVELHHLNGTAASDQERQQLALAPDGTVLARVDGLRLAPRPDRPRAEAGTR
ncbi:hotdog fold thioesterase [Streptomyces kroppenstedtii]|uniref:hotdog fold thioesterase n=1 Tax=Streptomyces kroppenstedtii TaxID=3051181 RepID=UPI0028D3055D|nr:beta-ketoacyl synthase N-terminal-like domain-containing protein [Streptomyces sp. DSM 40484]